MRLLFTVLFLFLLHVSLSAQVQITGRVVGPKNEPLVGVNVFLKDTYDGTSTNAAGQFSFATSETGAQVLVATMIGYAEASEHVEVKGQPMKVELKMAEMVNKLSGVTITAGSFEASDTRKNVVLRPLDIVTTASAAGDLVGAINTLPGTQRNGESGRLFVRGGESHEARLFIDGLYVNNPFQTAAPNLPARTRFSPMMFRGTNFSTGGYSAEYGQALSSTLSLQTIDYPARTQTDLSLMTVGAGLAHTRHGAKTSVTVDGAYTNLAPYFKLVPQNNPVEKAPESGQASLNFRQKLGKTGLLKIYSLASTSVLALRQPDPDNIFQERKVAIVNDYFYLNSSYKNELGAKFSIRGGAAYTWTRDQFGLGNTDVQQRERSLHAKSVLSYYLNPKITVYTGGEWLHTQYTRRLIESAAHSGYGQGFNENLLGAFVETEIHLSNQLAARVGGRVEYSDLLKRHNLAPRLNLAYKTGAHSQVSAAYGKFYQTPQPEWLLGPRKPDFELADHYILNYQRIQEGRIFRMEVYQKQYAQLVKVRNENEIRSDGDGYARGLDVFWRDKVSIKNADYWISYSLLDTKRNYLYNTSLQRPSFASAHNLSLVVKYFIGSLRSQVGFTQSLTSGRPYRDPNQPGEGFVQTPVYHDLSVNWSYLYKPHFIFHLSVSNVTGRENTFGYLYNPTPDANGVYQRKAIGQGAPRFIFLGVFITLSKDKNANQLNNL